MIAIWLVARAMGASVPRRLVYVVDRRAVVDQATSEAEKLRGWVDQHQEVKRALGLDRPLPISTLRGKHIDNREWLADPSAPAVVLGTIDMIGSRVLFGGYGISARMRPCHAGLLGVDSLIVLDEAHLVPPFERLIERIASGHDSLDVGLGPRPGLESIVPPVRLLSLSATGRQRSDALALTAADRADEIVAQRLRATKQTWIRDAVVRADLAARLAEEAWALCEGGTRPCRCIVYCDRRDDARKVRQALDALGRSKGVDRIDTQLFVGGRRYHERDMAARWLEDRGFFAGSKGRPQCATFVIATSAGEVGVDLDADHMVSDLVAWERMIQRLGRVNRRGCGSATVVVVPVHEDDEIVSARFAAARSVLFDLPRDPDGALDASPGALVALKERSALDPDLADRMARAGSPAPLHPALTRATIEAWSMTSIPIHPGRPELGPWIRGWIDEEPPQTTVAWRQWLPVTDAGDLLPVADLEAFREVADPHLAERLETETYRVREWLLARAAMLPVRDSDEQQPARLAREDVIAVVLDGPTAPRTWTGAEVLDKSRRREFEAALSGAILLVHVGIGGLDDGLLDDEDGASVVDLTQQTEGESWILPFRIGRREGTQVLEEDEGWRQEARFAVRRSLEDDVDDAWIVIETRLDQVAESEDARSGSAKRNQLLDEHQCWAEGQAGRMARRLGLPGPYVRMLEVAARLHDEGKRAQRWQDAFRAPADGIYAKTVSCPSQRILGGYRHELGSLPRAEHDDRVRALDVPMRELCLHLVAAHHGHARPLLRTDGAEEPPSRLEGRAREIALRFSSLQEAWGPWGLAWWETLVRTADWWASEQNDLEGRPRG